MIIAFTGYCLFLVTVRKGSNGGIFVSDLSTDNVSTSISNIIRLRNVSLKDLTEVRMELEKIVLVYAVDRMTEEDLDASEDSIHQAEKLLARGESPTKENLEFHLILSRAARNEMFYILMESVMKIVSQFLMELQPTRSQSEKVLEEHRFLLRPIRKRNRRQCAERMGKYLMKIEKRLSPLMEKKMLGGDAKSKE